MGPFLSVLSKIRSFGDPETQGEVCFIFLRAAGSRSGPGWNSFKWYLGLILHLRAVSHLKDGFDRMPFRVLFLLKYLYAIYIYIYIYIYVAQNSDRVVASFF